MPVRTLLCALVVLCLSAASLAQIGTPIVVGPPPLPVYDQPLCPGEGSLWTPGYWAYDYDFDDFYWVPGTWVHAPEIGFLWTPGFWGWGGDRFVFYDGYWAPHAGFYGGINYGLGYFGTGFEGGRWDNGHFSYNRAVTNLNVTEIHDVYDSPVTNNTPPNRVSYNGGNGGIDARPTAEEEAAARERHIPPLAVQNKQVQDARALPLQRASLNLGKPPVAATPKPGDIKSHAVETAKEAGGPYTRPVNGYRRSGQPEENPAAAAESNSNGNSNVELAAHPRAVHPNDLPALARPSAPNTGNPKLDRKFLREQEKQVAKHEREQQTLQQKQDKEHQRLAKRNASAEQNQQMEQRHQQETQQLQQRQERELQQLQEKQQQAVPRK